MKILLIDFSDDHQFSPLHWAAKGGHIKIVEILIGLLFYQEFYNQFFVSDLLISSFNLNVVFFVAVFVIKNDLKFGDGDGPNLCRVKK